MGTWSPLGASANSGIGHNNMNITVVASVCHALANISSPVCHEAIVVQDDMPMQMCLLSQPAIAEWKANSIYRGDQWTINRILCIPGDYQPKDAI